MEKSNPIRVLHVIGMMNRGGAETMIMNLYRNIDRSKVQFDFVQNDGPEAAFDEEIHSLGGKIYHCPRYTGKNHLTYVRWWHTFFREHGGEYSIVHGHIGSTAAIYLSVAKKYGAYTVAHSHSAGVGSLAYKILSYPTRYIADRFFACAADAAVSRFGKHVGEDKDRCQVLNNAVDTKKFVYKPAINEEKRQELGISETAIVIGHVGRFVAVKNHLFLIDVFERIHNQCPDCILLLIGDGELRPQIEAAIAEKDIKDVVILAGLKQDVWNYYQVMDVFAFPSIFEGVPVSLVEAQGAGLPCCVSTGIPEEAAITDLVQFCSLEEAPETWAQWIMERAKLLRRDMSEEIRQAGYDISETSRWLENFYLEVERKRGK